MSFKPTFLNIICFILFFIFLILKLAKVGIVATWSWWIVLSPLLLLGLFFGIGLIVIGLPYLILGYSYLKETPEEFARIKSEFQLRKLLERLH